MPPRPLVLLPPSAGKAGGGDGPAWTAGAHRFGELADLRRSVRAAVDARLNARRPDLTKLFGVSARGVDAALYDWHELDRAATLPAMARYTGVVWDALSPATLSPGARRRLSSRVIVVSGLWGLLGAGDRIPPYRLPIGTTVVPIGSLARFWRPHLGAALAAHARGGWVFDLLPDDHAAAIDLTGLRRCRVQIVLDGPGGQRPMGHAGKALKGRLARAILEADPRTPAALADLRVPGLAWLAGDGERAVFLAES